MPTITQFDQNTAIPVKSLDTFMLEEGYVRSEDTDEREDGHHSE